MPKGVRRLRADVFALLTDVMKDDNLFGFQGQIQYLYRMLMQ